MSYDFTTLAKFLAFLSFGLVGTILAGSAIFPEVSPRYKRMIPDIITGIILVFLASAFLNALGG